MARTSCKTKTGIHICEELDGSLVQVNQLHGAAELNAQVNNGEGN